MQNECGFTRTFANQLVATVTWLEMPFASSLPLVRLVVVDNGFLAAAVAVVVVAAAVVIILLCLAVRCLS